jgi:hypothetical protein
MLTLLQLIQRPLHFHQVAVVQVRHPVDFARHLVQAQRQPCSVDPVGLVTRQLLVEKGRLQVAATKFFEASSGACAFWIASRTSRALSARSHL